jgi:hypothetical protein
MILNNISKVPLIEPPFLNAMCGIISIRAIVAAISPAMMFLATAVTGSTHIRLLGLITLATEKK